MERLAGLLFELRDLAHLSHLKVQSYAKHIALNEFYDALLLLLDDLIEQHQGQYGLLDITISKTESKDDIVSDLEKAVKTIKSEKFNFIDKDDTHLHNILDEIVSLITKTIYKLKYLK